MQLIVIRLPRHIANAMLCVRAFSQGKSQFVLYFFLVGLSLILLL
jgi:hypothetical protein